MRYLLPSAGDGRQQKPRAATVTPVATTGLKVLILLFSAGIATSHSETNLFPYRLGSGEHTLKVIVRTGLAGWYHQGDRAKGLEYDLLNLFAREYNKQLDVKLVHNAAQAFADLEKYNASIAAGLLVIPESKRKIYHGSPAYLTLKQTIIHRYDTARLSSETDIRMSNIDLNDNPAQLETLAEIKRRNNDPGNWVVHEKTSTQELMELTDQEIVDYAVMDSREALLYRWYYPRLNQSFTISDKLPATWVLRGSNETLHDEIEQFFSRIEKSGVLSNLIDRYYGHVKHVDYPEKLAFMENFIHRLSKYRPIFKETGNFLDIDWKMLAAISYQESHWNPDAQSPSGVLGLMMITKEIARKFSVEDRQEPVQNVLAGTRCFPDLRKRLSDSIKEPERDRLAMVTCNVGCGYLQRALKLTGQKGLDPSLWVHVRDTFG